MDIVDPRIDAYMAGRLARFDEPVLLEMEDEAERRHFPIVRRNVGVTLEVLARSIGTRRMIELGSGFGYSAYWHSRAVGSSGELHLTDGDPANQTAARDYLNRAGLWDPVSYHVGDAVEALNALEGEFDLSTTTSIRTAIPTPGVLPASGSVSVASMFATTCSGPGGFPTTVNRPTTSPTRSANTTP